MRESARGAVTRILQILTEDQGELAGATGRPCEAAYRESRRRAAARMKHGCSDRAPRTAGMRESSR